MRPPRSCLLVDDSRPILDALAQLLENEGFDVVAKADTGAKALDAVARCTFDAIILDYRLPDISGLEVAEQVAERSSAPIVFYTSYADPAFVSEALDAGARAVVLKDAPPKNLLLALDAVAAGDVYVDARLSFPRRPAGS